MPSPVQITNYVSVALGQLTSLFARGRPDPVAMFAADLSTPAAGDMSAAAFLAQTGLSFSRASDGFTVQDTPSTLISGLTGNDRPRFANGIGGTLGLVLEDSRKNQWTRSNDSTAGGGGGSGNSVSVGYATGPDGVTLADRVQCNSGGFSGYFPAGILPHGIASLWVRQAVGSVVYQAAQGDGATFSNAHGSTGASWTKVQLSAYSGGSYAFVPADGRDWHLQPGGVAAGARDAVVAWMQIEGSKTGGVPDPGDGAAYGTEAITTAGAGATRAAERLYHATGAAMVSGGQLSLELKFVPKASQLSDYLGTTVQVWYVDANNQAFFTASTGVLTVKIGGVTQSFAGAVSVAGTFEMFLCAGGGLATTLAYRSNGGAVTKPSSPGALSSLVVAGALDIMCQGTAHTFAAWVQTVKAWPTRSGPAWAA